MGRSVFVRCVGAALLALTLGCQQEEADAATAEPTISAKALLESVLSDVPESIPRYSTGPGPVFSIAESEAPVFFQFRDFYTGVVLPDGGAAVLNDRVGEMVLLAPDGTPVSLIGRRGEGPREFTGATGIVPGPDGTIVVYDRALKRASRWSAEGEYLGATPRGPARVTRETAIGWVSGVGIGLCRSSNRRLSRPETEARPDYRCAMEYADRVRAPVLVDGPETYHLQPMFFESDFGRMAWALPGHLQPRVRTTIVGDAVIQADGGRGAVTVSRTTGTEVAFAWPWVRTPIDEPFVQAFAKQQTPYLTLITRDPLFGSRPDPVDLSRELLSQIEGQAPVFYDVMPDPSGRIWLALDPRDPDIGRWLIIDLSGEPVGVVAIPEGFTPIAVRGDLVLGKRLKEYDTPYAEMYRLTPVAPPTPLTRPSPATATHSQSPTPS